ncbi:hypothetical protein IRJ41_017465 [Triplophysa rosa]|uniref:Uncharacterized protein n=1 Tax=Triplophysa rosa TaxID=992332 RepID=A0A9W7TS48_TRIRA|nr:hypothetical protein IRJ41_017465 [Triplophysa rosa]
MTKRFSCVTEMNERCVIERTDENALLQKTLMAVRGATAVFGLRGNAEHFIILMSRTQTAALPPRVLSDFNPSSFMESNGGAFTPTEGRRGGRAAAGRGRQTSPDRRLELLSPDLGDTADKNDEYDFCS